jgi:hypothetical protein
MFKNIQTQPPLAADLKGTAVGADRFAHREKLLAEGNLGNRGMNSVLEWIDAAEWEERTWARNLLVGFGILVTVLLLAFRSGSLFR